MKTLGPGMGPGSKIDLLSQPKELKPNRGEKTPDVGERKSFSEIVRERTPDVRKDAGPKTQASRRDRADEPRPNDRQNDSRQVKVENKGKSSKPAGNAGVDKTESRKQAMLQFMDSMENEFGITPARMLEAMAQVDSEVMTLAPENTAAQVIENLELPQEDQAAAMALYAGFITQWRELQEIPQPWTAGQMPAEAMPAGPGLETRGLPGLQSEAAGAKVLGAAGLMSAGAATASKAGALDANVLEGFEAVKPGEASSLLPGKAELPLSAAERRAQLNSSLDQMNARFFVKPDAQLAPVQDLPAHLMQTASADTQVPTEALPAFSQDDSGLYSAKPIGEAAIGFGALAGLMPGKLEWGADAATAKAAPAVASESESALAALMAEVEGAGEHSDSESSENFDAETGADTGSLEAGPQDLSRAELARGDFSQLLKPAGAPGAGAGAAAAMMMPMDSSDKAEALEVLKDQTQIMATKGGGEAKISFNQEGLGEISLKVTVHDGKVNVEMGAETQEAKKLLESSLGDLKASLAHQKLSVENVRVDVGSSGLNDQNKQPPMNFGQDMGRDQARQMMQQFRDDTSGRRDPFFEMSGVKAYSRAMPGPAPIPAAPDRAINRYTGQGRGDRMNIVA